MKVELEENELEASIREYINTLGFDLSSKNVNITFRAGRGPTGGYSASVEITPYKVNPTPVEAIPRTVDTSVSKDTAPGVKATEALFNHNVEQT